MTTLQLRAELLNEINPIFDDDSLMREVIDFVRGLTLKKRKEKAVPIDIPHDSDEYILSGLSQSFKEFKEYKEGKRHFKTADEFLKELDEV